MIKHQRRKNARLFQHLITSARKKAIATNLPLFVSNSHSQQGPDFGARLTSELEKVFAKGFEKVLIIGNDCPQLTSDHLLKAAEKCTPAELILGPTPKGGAFLIALHKAQFDPNAFRSLDWERNTLIDSFWAYAKQQAATVTQLETLNDLNTPAQLDALLAQLDRTDSFKNWVLRLLNHLANHVFHFLIRSSKYSPSSLHLSRAP